MKKIAIIGANGRTGIELVAQALEKDYIVRGLVRDKDSINVARAKLDIIEGTPMNFEDTEKAVQDVDAVYVALNISRKKDHPWSQVISPPDLLKESMKNIVEAMNKYSIKRLITISAWGVGDSYAEVNWMFRFLINKTNVGTAYKGHEEQEQILRDSDLDWTAVRPVGLSDQEKSRPSRVSLNGNKKLNMMISRKDVARFMLDISDDESYYRNSPSISNN